jgi:predicted ATPase
MIGMAIRISLCAKSGICQVIMATHAPFLMAYANARLLRLTKHSLEPVTLEATEHFQLMRKFCANPASFLDAMLAE